MTELLKGFIAAEEGLREALEFVTSLKEVNSGVLEIKSKTVNGRVGIAWGRFITGALTEDGQWGKKALRKLLTVRQGKFSFVDTLGEPVQELRQSLGIDLNGVFPYVPLEIVPAVTPWLFEPGEQADALVSAPINLMDTVDIDKPDLSELHNPISAGAARAAAYLPPLEDEAQEAIVQDPLAGAVIDGSNEPVAVSPHPDTSALIELEPVSDPLLEKISERIADIASLQLQPEIQPETEPELFDFSQSAVRQDLQPPLPKLAMPTAGDFPEPPVTPAALTPTVTSDIIRPPGVFNPLEMSSRPGTEIPSQLPPVPAMELPAARQASERLLPAGAIAIDMPGTAEPPTRMVRQRPQNANNDAVGIAIVCALFFVVSCAGTVAFGPRVWAVVSSIMQTH